MSDITAVQWFRFASSRITIRLFLRTQLTLWVASILVMLLEKRPTNTVPVLMIRKLTMTMSHLPVSHSHWILSCCCLLQVYSGNYKSFCACTCVIFDHTSTGSEHMEPHLWYLIEVPDLCPVDVLYRCGRFLRMASSLPCLSQWWYWRATPSVWGSSHGTQQLAMSFLVQVKKEKISLILCPEICWNSVWVLICNL